MKTRKPVMLMILDGWGLGEDYPGNAIYIGDTPVYDSLMKTQAHSELEASGEAVGLPDGQMGNSEVGHLNMGAGRVVYQDLPRISREISTGDFFKKPEFLDAIEYSREKKSKIHLVGMISDGGVHCHNTHLYALLELMKRENVEDVYVHSILDGRDVGPKTGLFYMSELEKEIDRLGVGKIATVAGRYYSMDRDRRWDRTELAYNAMVDGIGKRAEDPLEAIEESYNKDITDEFLLPTVIYDGEEPVTKIDDDDVIIFFNFRPDRVRQITRAFVDEDFDNFNRRRRVSTHYMTMTDYDSSIKNVVVAYSKYAPANTLSEYLSNHGLKQIKIAETEKYAHVTFFMNGGIEEPYKYEDRALIASPDVATYDLAPKMSAEKVKNQVIKSLDEDKYDFITVNFANPDMVGHTGKIDKAVEAVEEVDSCMGEIIKKAEEKGVVVLITADHGNVESLLTEDNKPVTAHTTNKVPLILFGENGKLKSGILADIAPTILDIMNIDKPEEMTGESLLIGEE